MREEFVNPFIDSAVEILEKEVQVKVLQKGDLSINISAKTSQEVTVLIAITGTISGTLLYGMKEETALKIASAMLGENIDKFDDIAQSAIAELGNIISGNASMVLEKSGFPSKLSPPILITGKNTQISTIDIERLAITLTTNLGDFEIDVAIKLDFTLQK